MSNCVCHARKIFILKLFNVQCQFSVLKNLPIHSTARTHITIDGMAIINQMVMEINTRGKNIRINIHKVFRSAKINLNMIRYANHLIRFSCHTYLNSSFLFLQIRAIQITYKPHSLEF